MSMDFPESRQMATESKIFPEKIGSSTSLLPSKLPWAHLVANCEAQNIKGSEEKSKMALG